MPKVSRNSLRALDGVPIDEQSSKPPSMSQPRSICLVLLLAACCSTQDAYDATPKTEVSLPPVDLSEWRSEHITLPPEFAPSMPAGEELLLFAPGMFDQNSEDFWSYVFLMQIEWSNVDATRMTTLFEAYFDGLLLAVAKDRGEDIGTNPAHVNVQQLDAQHYSLEVLLVDSFVTLETIKLHILVETTAEATGGLLLLVQASPQPQEHNIWRELKAAVHSLTL